MGVFQKKNWNNCKCSLEGIKKMANIYFKELSWNCLRQEIQYNNLVAP